MGVKRALHSRTDKTANIGPTGKNNTEEEMGNGCCLRGLSRRARTPSLDLSDQPGRFGNKRSEFAHKKKQEQIMPMDQLDRALIIVVKACCNVAPHADLTDTRT
jgi:hypothetical protein